MAADVASYSRLVAEDEEETLHVLADYREVFEDFVDRYGGRIFNTAGDSVMSEFKLGGRGYWRAAIDIQEALRTRNLAHPPKPVAAVPNRNHHRGCGRAPGRAPRRWRSISRRGLKA